MRHARRPTSHRVARTIALGVTAVLLFGVTGAAAVALKFQGNIKSRSVASLLGNNRPKAAAKDPHAGQDLNVLLVGSDSRGGADASIGGKDDGMRSDTAIVMHLSADRRRIDLVSIPRDTLVDIPACQRSNGTTSRPQKNGQFNSAFNIGSQSGQVSDAAACTLTTIEQDTGISFGEKANYVVIDFAGFEKMINALGGVPICIPETMKSPLAGLNLKAGQQTLDGATALAFARARHGVGDGSDTGRIGRQQQLLAAMVRNIQSRNMLTDAPALFKFLNAATSSVTASPDLASITGLTGLAISLRGTRAADITFMTIPFATAPTDKDRVVMTSAAKAIWANMAADKPLAPAPVATSPATAAPGATAAPSTTAAPTAVKTPGPGGITAADVTTKVCG